MSARHLCLLSDSLYNTRRMRGNTLVVEACRLPDMVTCGDASSQVPYSTNLSNPCSTFSALCIMYALTCTRYEHNYMLYVHRKFSGLQMTASADENTARNMAKKGIKEARECIQETVCETRRSPEIFVREKKTWSSKILCRYTSERAGTKSERSGVDRYPEILIKRARGIRGRYEQQLML